MLINKFVPLWLIVVCLRQCICFDYNLKNLKFYMTDGFESIQDAYCTFTECCTNKYVPANITGKYSLL